MAYTDAPAKSTLQARARPVSDAEWQQIPWVASLTAQEADEARATLRISQAMPGDVICRVGRKANYWFGLFEGLLKMSNDDSRGPMMTFTGVAAGGWFGEGTLIKRETYRYNVQAIRKSLVAGVPIDTFLWLLDNSIGFNRYIIMQLNERLGQFIAAREIDRIGDPDTKVARTLAALFNPVLYPSADRYLRITQQELAYLVGLSRQRVNLALSALQEAGAIEVAYGGVRVMDLGRLRRVGTSV